MEEERKLREKICEFLSSFSSQDFANNKDNSNENEIKELKGLKNKEIFDFYRLSVLYYKQIFKNNENDKNNEIEKIKTNERINFDKLKLAKKLLLFVILNFSNFSNEVYSFEEISLFISLYRHIDKEHSRLFLF